MSRTGLLLDLANELRRLYTQNIDEHLAYNTLQADERFKGLINLAKVQEIYRQLQSASPSSLVQPFDFSILNQQSQQLIFPFYKTKFVCDHQIQPCLKRSFGFSVNGRFVFYHIRSQIGYPVAGFLLHDTFSNKERYITLEKRRDVHFSDFIFLNENLGLLFERNSEFIFSSVVELDWTKKRMRKTQTSDLLPNDSSRVLIDPLNPEQVVFSHAIFQMGIQLRFCSIQGNQIAQERAVSREPWPYFAVNSLFDGKLYGFEHRNLHGKLLHPAIRVNSLEPNSNLYLFVLEWPSDDFYVLYSMDEMICCWIRDRFYVVVKFEKGAEFGIAWASCETLKWTLLKFQTDERIIKLQFVVESSTLLVQTVDAEMRSVGENTHGVKHTFYRIPFKKPESLSNLAWSALVQLKSKLPNIDPYEEARRYLPFTSEIQYPFEK